MSVLGIDTSTAASAACVVRADGEVFEVAPDPAVLTGPPAHARELLPAVAEAMTGAGLDFGDLKAIAIGVGPGSFTGLRIGVTTARALASANGLPLTPVSSLAALAAGIAEHGATLAERGPAAADPIQAALLPVIDAKRGEVFAALLRSPGEPVWGPVAEAPETIAERVRDSGLAPVAAGDGSIRFRGVLEAAGIGVAPDESVAHVVRALHVCRLAGGLQGRPPQAVLPDYLRAPDAKPQ
jgi:tRNA threonylcarbamoyladenosine biosynthesis protein TsaB